MCWNGAGAGVVLDQGTWQQARVRGCHENWVMGVDTVSSVQDVCGVQWTIDLWAVCNATQRNADGMKTSAEVSLVHGPCPEISTDYKPA